MSEIASIAAAESLAASGTANVVIPVSGNTQEMVIQVGVEYGAVSATASGVSVHYNLSTNNGASYVASAQAPITVAPAAGVLGTKASVLRLGSDPYRVDQINYPTDVQLVLTNLDGTNAAQVAVVSQESSHQP